MIAVGGWVSEGHPLPSEGIDLRAELASHQRERVEQAVALAQGEIVLAAKLLGVTPLDLMRLQAGHSVRASAGAGVHALPGGKARSSPVAPVSPQAPRVRLEDISRMDRGVEVISRGAIRRLHTDGFTPRQIATRLGVNPFVIEKVLRAEAEIRKCGPLPPEQIP